MTSQLQRPQVSTADFRKSEDFSGRLTDILLDLQREDATGIAWVEVLLDNEISQRVIVLRNGSLIYAGKGIPTPHEFVAELARYARVGVLETVLEFAAKRSSIQSVLRAMVEIGVLQWPEIAAAARQQALAVLEGLHAVTGRVRFERDLAAFDLHYDEREAGFSVEALLLECKLRRDKQAPSAPLPADKAQGGKPVILSVDDSTIAQALVKRALRQDYDTIACGCTIDALGILKQREDISAILLDLTLPDVDGLDFCRMLRRIEKYKGLPIVMLTARNGMMDRVRGRFAGTTHFLTKPVKTVELLAILARYVA